MASKYKGYTGKMLDIDLTTGFIGEYPLSDTDRELFVGSRALSTKIMWDTIRPGIDPLGPENVIIINTGPLTGTGAPSSSRYDISAKSPLTGKVCHSNSGGNFGLHMKRAGWDGIVIRGQSAKPVYIEIENDNVSIKDAAHMWGKNTHEAQHAMGRGGTVVIGPAGENRVLYATLVSQERSHGRGGMGAVMGSKNLKGLVARGTKKIEVAEPEKLKELYKRWVNMLRNHPFTGDLAARYGTAYFLELLNKGNALPTKNFSRGSYVDAQKVGGIRMAEEFMVKNYGCVSCPIRCGRVVDIDGKHVKGPEYEILCLLGSNMLINDMEAILRWNYELDLLGIDAISVGTVMGFAAELDEKGMWDSGVKFGKSDNISQLLEDIAFRRGVGDELANGVRFLSQKYGGQDFAPQVKGMEMAAYEPRGAVGQGLGYSTANRGGCHLDAGYMIMFEVSGPAVLKQYHARSKPSWAVLAQNLMAAVSSCGQCLFTALTMLPPPLYKIPNSPLASKIASEIMTAIWPTIELVDYLPTWLMPIHLPLLPHSKAMVLATGMKFNYGRFMATGMRGFTLERMFNLREGMRGTEDTLPKRFLEDEQIPGRPETKVPLGQMLPLYYKIRGWDENGVPRAKTLKKLGLEFAILK